MCGTVVRIDLQGTIRPLGGPLERSNGHQNGNSPYLDGRVGDGYGSDHGAIPLPVRYLR